MVDSVPDNVAHDTTIPGAYTKRLQPAISCIRCHGNDNGWKPFSNRLDFLLKRMNIVDDLSQKDERKALDKISSEYGADFTSALKLTRVGALEPIFKATSGQTVDEASAAISEVYARYNYTEITPQRAAKDLGIKAEELPELRNKLLGLDGIAIETPFFHELAEGRNITPQDWEREFSTIYTRVLHRENDHELDD